MVLKIGSFRMQIVHSSDLHTKNFQNQRILPNPKLEFSKEISKREFLLLFLINNLQTHLKLRFCYEFRER